MKYPWTSQIFFIIFDLRYGKIFYQNKIFPHYQKTITRWNNRRQKFFKQLSVKKTFFTPPKENRTEKNRSRKSWGEH